MILTHDCFIDNLEDRLKHSNKYSFVEAFFEYDIDGVEGDVDVLSYRKDNNTYYFWEVESKHNKRSIARAHKKYEDLCKVYPDAKVRGVIVTKKGMYKLTIENK